ncbi:MAG: phosphatidylglycerophosphatase A [Verrucomicrobiota bacterium]
MMVKFLATGFGIGYIPKAPGTFGSILGIGLWWLLKDYLPYHAILILAAVWIAGAAAKQMNDPDPSSVVIDEIVGMPIALAGITPVWWQIAVGFAAFRLFDIWKPFPIRQSQQLPGGWGIVVDDLLAGICACLTTHAIAWSCRVWLPA